MHRMQVKTQKFVISPKAFLLQNHHTPDPCNRMGIFGGVQYPVSALLMEVSSETD